MHQIAYRMRVLHSNGILHGDLKAANVLLGHDIEKGINLEQDIALQNSYVADFESCGGVMGSGFWKAPGILLAVKNNAKDRYSYPEIWTKKVDGYSYAITCYEVLTGCVPFQNRAPKEYDGVIEGERPPLPDYVDHELRELLRRCWHSDPLMRPSFQEIYDELARSIDKRREIYISLAGNERGPEGERWIRCFRHVSILNNFHEWESDDESST